MVQRSKRVEHIPEPERVMSALAECRKVMLDQCAKVRPMGPAYNALSVVIAAVDALATFITKHPYWFARGGGYMTDQERHARAEEHAAMLRKWQSETGE